MGDDELYIDQRGRCQVDGVKAPELRATQTANDVDDRLRHRALINTRQCDLHELGNVRRRLFPELKSDCPADLDPGKEG